MRKHVYTIEDERERKINPNYTVKKKKKSFCNLMNCPNLISVVSARIRTTKMGKASSINSTKT